MGANGDRFRGRRDPASFMRDLRCWVPNGLVFWTVGAARASRFERRAEHWMATSAHTPDGSSGHNPVTRRITWFGFTDAKDFT